MIYQLAELLRNQFPTETVYINGRILVAGQESIPDRNLLLNETGGNEQPWTKYSSPTVQVISRDVDAPKARKLSYDVLEFLTGRFGVILPSITVGGVLFPAIQTAQISAIQLPYNLGADSEGRIEFTTNYQIILTR